MTSYCLELRSTQDWRDVRYRAYTSSVRRMEKFKTVPKIQFNDSGHGIVPVVNEVKGPRLPRIRTLVKYVDQWMQYGYMPSQEKDHG